MSLINQMLHDLEQRSASAGKTEPISGEVRAVSGPKSKSPSLLLVGLVLVALGVGAGAWVYLSRAPKPTISVAAKALPAVVVPSAPPVVTASATSTELPPSAALMPALPAATIQPAEVARRLPGLDTTLEAVPAIPAKPSPVSNLPEGKAPGLAPVAAPAAAEALKEPVAKGAFQPAGADPVKPKPAFRAVPGNAGTSLKTISPSQQSDNLYRQAVGILQQGRVAEAQDALRKALEANPLNLKARQSLVGLLVEGKHNDEAIALLQDGLKLSPEQSGFSMALARLQVEAGDAVGASATLQRGLQYAGEDADYHAFYAALMQREERHDDAVAHYLVALRSNPAMPSWLVGIGISWQAQGKLADAREAYQRARDTGQLTPQLAQFVDQRLNQVKQLR